VQFLQGGLGPFRGLDAPRAPKANDNSWLMAKSTAAWPLQRMVPAPQRLPQTSFPSRPNDEVYCFEVNPCPGFSYYEANTSQPISAAVARRLASGRPAPQASIA